MAVIVAVNVGLGVRVGVAEGPACRSGRSCDKEQANETQASRMTIAMMARRFFIVSPVGRLASGFGYARQYLAHYNRDTGFLQESQGRHCSLRQIAHSSDRSGASQISGIHNDNRCVCHLEHMDEVEIARIRCARGTESQDTGALGVTTVQVTQKVGMHP